MPRTRSTGFLRRSGGLRLAVGVAISAVFLAATLSRVDLAVVGAAMAGAAPAGLAAALVIVIVDLGLRAWRWQLLLHGVRDAPTRPPYRLAVGYLMIGFTANAVLPARLGDVARAVLAGSAFRTPRLAVFGTIMIERVGDGLTMLALALVSSLVVAGIAELRDLAVFAVAAGLAGIVGLALGWLVLARSAVGATRLGTVATGLARRLAAGAGALTTARGAVSIVGLTWVAAGTAMLVAWSISSAVGVTLGPAEVVLFTSGVALSLAIPAAPGALGTYEFVGVAIVTGLGFSPEQGLATILLMRILSTFPPALAGLVSLWALQVRPGALVGAGEGEGAATPAAGAAP